MTSCQAPRSLNPSEKMMKSRSFCLSLDCLSASQMLSGARLLAHALPGSFREKHEKQHTKTLFQNVVIWEEKKKQQKPPDVQIGCILYTNQINKMMDSKKYFTLYLGQHQILFLIYTLKCSRIFFKAIGQTDLGCHPFTYRLT